MHPFTIIFLAALLAHLAVQLWLARRQVSHVLARRAAVPQAFAEVVTPAEHMKAADYTVARQRLGMLEAIFDSVILLAMTLGGGIAAARMLVDAAVAGPIARGTLLVLVVFTALAVLTLPFGIYRTFVVEQRFGFNRTTPATYVADLAKGWLLATVLGGSVTACVLWIMGALGRSWWLAAWLVWTAFTLALTWAWPRFLAPVFNKFRPLEDPALRARIDALLGRCGFHAKGVFVMDGSRRSAHGNAYFTGIGREKRIVFFDTLLATLTPPQVESVLAHELAHFRLRHVPQRLLVGLLASLAGFALLGWLARQSWFYPALGVPEPGDASALVLFILVAPSFTWLVSPLASAWSRRHEFQADAFAARHSDAHAMASALVTLYRDNASTLTPDPVHSAFYDSHPPPAARIERLLKFPSSTPAAAASS
ncbi:MAG: M48 family metallopeptidase [Steroidobacteraceae bacterium]